eukprot:GFUD01038421.1.p1 GENE.GFUD01038421.1~~GFUD01038421.1.p1  ORF type:complete len:551 (+),score=165.91 GFUD01038421.1:94-1746(+)
MGSFGRQEFSSEVYRDKNTLVEVTIHRKPKSASRNNLIKEKGISGKLLKREKDENRSRDNFGKNRIIEEKISGERNVQEVLQELKNVVRVSETKDVQKILEDFRDGMNLGKQNIIPKSLKLSSQLDLQDLEEKINKLETNYQECRKEANRCKQDNEEMVKQVDFGNNAIKSLELQMVDLKNVISRLVRNNGELLGIVSQKIEYEELVVNLEQKMMALSDHLRQEKSHSSYLEQKLHSAESEASCLRSVSKDLNGRVELGLGGLEQPRLSSRPSFPLLGENIFGITKKGGKQDNEDKSDPNENALYVHRFGRSCTIKEQARLKESPQSRPKKLHHQHVPLLSKPSMLVFTKEANSQPSLSLTPPSKMFSRKQSLDTLDSALLPSQVAPFLSNSNLDNPPHPSTEQISQPASPTLQKPSQSNSPSTNTFPPPHRAQSRCSTLANAPSFIENLIVDLNTTYHPTLLDLSETLSQSDGIEKQYFGVNQESLHLNLNITQPQSFQIPLMNETRETYNTSNTSLTEGKFFKGLETSIEVKLEEFSEVSDIEHFVTI